MTPVHTTGVNWASVLTIIFGSVGCISVILGFFSRYLARYIAGEITGAMNKLRLSDLAGLVNRVLVLEVLAGVVSREEIQNAVHGEEKGRQRRMGGREHRERGSQGNP